MNKKVLPLTILFLITVLIILTAIIFLSKYQQNDFPNVSEQCGIENCHGLNIVCGKPAEICTMIYQLGDKCREFAQCGLVNNVCQQIENPQFTACKSCALKCENDFPNDPDKAFMCESNC